MRPVCYLLCISLCTAWACRNYQPKPKGYNRFELPPHAYQATPDTLPYSFEYSRYAVLQPDTSPIRDRYWVEVTYPSMHAAIHITYEKLHGDLGELRSYLKDAYTLTAKHRIKAYAIDEQVFKTPLGKTAMVVQIEGETPSQLQFTVTDSLRNFFRGAVYFKLKVQNDSLQPAIAYAKRDALHLINTLQWKEISQAQSF